MMLVVVVHSFLVFVLLLLFFIRFFLFDFVLHSLLFKVIPHSSVDYRRVFTPILYFQPIPSKSDSLHLHFNLSDIFFRNFIVRATVLIENFFTQRCFLPCVPSLTFYLRLSRPPWEPAVLSSSFQGFILILETQTQPIYLFDSQ